MRVSVISLVLLSMGWSASAQRLGDIMAVEPSEGTYVCRTIEVVEHLRNKDLAAALANGKCIHLSRGQAVRILSNDVVFKDGFFHTVLGPRLIEVVANPQSGHWYIAFGALGEAMLKSLEDLEREFKNQTQIGRPTATQSAYPASQYYTRTELMPIAQSLLAETGITDYKFLPPSVGGDLQLAWEYSDGTMAMLAIVRPEAKIVITDFLAMTIEQDARFCKGQYSSGYMPARYYLGSEIRKTYTACADGTKSHASYYSVLALPSGAIMRFSTGATQSNLSPEAVPRADRLENAALRPAQK